MSETITEDHSLPTMQRGLSDWWTEETEYVFQRIERWAAFARGYNRLRSQRYSRGRLTMTEEPAESGWNISGNKLVVDDRDSWNPNFHNLQRSRRRKSRPAEETRINCCGTFNYQSNNNLDSSCLETYRYDHSIYFKTIGDIRSGGKNRRSSLNRAELNPRDFSPELTNDQEQIEWSAKTIGEIECHRCDDDPEETDVYEFLNNEHKQSLEFGGIDVAEKNEQRSKSSKSSQVWPIVDLTQLDIKNDEGVNYSCSSEIEGCNGNHTIVQIDELDDEEANLNNNNNYFYYSSNDNDDKNNENNEITNKNSKRRESSEVITDIVITEDNKITARKINQSFSPKKQEDQNSKRLVSIRRTRQSPRKISQPTVVGENNVVWPGVLLNYKKNVDPVYSPHRHSIKK